MFLTHLLGGIRAVAGTAGGAMPAPRSSGGAIRPGTGKKR
jgi:hypothetical protein